MLTYRDFRELWAYYQLEPWGEERADLRAALIAQTVANRHRDPKQEQPYRLQDFLLTFEAQAKPPQRQRQSPQEMRAVLDAFVAMTQRGA